MVARKNRTRRVEIRATNEEYSKLLRLAEARGLSRADTIRTVLLETPDAASARTKRLKSK